MRSKLIAIRFSSELLEEIDKTAKANLNSRSGFIRETLVLRLRKRHITPEPKPHELLELLKHEV